MKPGIEKSRANRVTGTALVAAIALMAPLSVFAEKQEPMQTTHDGLTLVDDRKVAAAYIDADADLGIYDKIMILDCYVAFKKNWEKKAAKTGSRIRISSSDVERIKKDVAALFRDVFTEKLSENDGYEIVNEAGEDVLLVRPAIIDLDIAAPDTGSVGRSRTYTASTGSATVYIELYDSVTGDILARAADSRAAGHPGGFMMYTNRVTNRADARRMLGSWADLLRTRLDELHGK